MIHVRAVVCFLCVTACSSTASPSPDAGSMDTEGQFGVGCEGHTSPVATFTMPQSEVGQTVSVRLDVPAHTDTVTFSITGPDATAFSVMQEDSGRTDLVFVSTDVRTYNATVIASTTSGVLAQMTVTANVVANAGPLRLSTPFVELGLGQSIAENARPIVVVNQSSSMPVDLGPVLVTADDSDLVDIDMVASPPGPSTLGPGESCTFYVVRDPGALGCRKNHIAITSSANTVEADATVSVSVDAQLFAVNGEITTTVGPSCTNDCQISFLDGPVVATATPAPGFRFVGWNQDSGCGVDPTCTLQLPFGPTAVGALFAPTFSPQTTIMFAGRGHVVVSTPSGAVACDHDCTVSALRPEDPITLGAATLSPFGGWSGACVGTDPQCQLGTPQHDQATTATFDKDAQEVATVSAPGDSHNGTDVAAFLSNGDVIIGTASTISRVAMDGTLVWSRPAGVADVAVTPNDTIIYLNYRAFQPTLFALDSAGHRLWMRALTSDPTDENPVDHPIAVTSTGDVAVLANSELTMVDVATGLEAWKKTFPTARSVAADHAGVIAVATYDEPSIVAHRYTLAGDEILPAWPISDGNWEIRIAFDTGNALVADVNVLGAPTLSRYDATGALVFTMPAASFADTALVGTQIVQLTYGTDNHIEMTVTSSTGALVSTLDKPPMPIWFFEPSMLASDGVGRIAIVGVQGTTSFTRNATEVIQISP